MRSAAGSAALDEPAVSEIPVFANSVYWPSLTVCVESPVVVSVAWPVPNFASDAPVIVSFLSCAV